MRRALNIFLFLFIGFFYRSGAQSFKKGDIILNANMGVPHLFKGIVKLAVKSDAFKKNFDGILEVSKITGINPLVIKGEFGLGKMFGIGVNFSTWTIKFDVTDHYNAQNIGAGNIYTDSVDVYKLKLTSKSFGIRPNFHFPIKNRKHDVYFGIGLGITNNKLNLNFESTDADRFSKNFDRKLEYDLSLPGGFYFAPSVGYRVYFNSFVGLNFEIGYEKGAILQGGIVFRFNLLKQVTEKE